MVVLAIVIVFVSLAMTVLIRPELFFKSLIGGRTRPIRRYKIENDNLAGPTATPAAPPTENKDENHG
jgi:hypothetical protein